MQAAMELEWDADVSNSCRQAPETGDRNQPTGHVSCMSHATKEGVLQLVISS